MFEGIGGACFTPDAQWVFYVKLDDAWRPYAVMRHRVGTPIVDDVEVYREQDERFWVGIGLSFDERNLVIGTGSKTTTEVLLLSTDDPEGEFRAFIPREQDVEYDVSFSRFEGAGECGEDIPLAVVYHNALNPNFEIDVIDMRSHEPRTVWVRACVWPSVRRTDASTATKSNRALLRCRSAHRIPIPAIQPFCRVRMVLALRGSRFTGIMWRCSTGRKA